jgi:hypothetical protein
VASDIIDAAMTARGVIAVHTPPAFPEDGSATPGLVLTHLCAP